MELQVALASPAMQPRDRGLATSGPKAMTTAGVISGYPFRPPDPPPNCRPPSPFLVCPVKLVLHHLGCRWKPVGQVFVLLGIYVPFNWIS